MKNVPAVTIDQMREVDRLMVEEVGVSIRMMMENASRNIAVLSRKMLGGSVKAKEYIGELYIADLSVPQVVYEKLGIDVPMLFEHEEIIKVN